MISHVIALRAEVVEEAAAVVDGAAAAPPATAEPEVIKKGKKEEEGGREGAKGKKAEKTERGEKESTSSKGCRNPGFWWWGSAIPGPNMSTRLTTSGSWRWTALAARNQHPHLALRSARPRWARD